MSSAAVTLGLQFIFSIMIELQEMSQRDLVYSEVVGTGDSHFMKRVQIDNFAGAQIVESSQDAQGVLISPHHELAGWDQAELHSQRVRELDVLAEVLRPGRLMGFG